MTHLEHQARKCLEQLVSHVYAHQGGPLKGLTYQDLAFKIGRKNKGGQGHGHGMGQVLEGMGNLLRGLEGEWGEAIPHIQSLGINKTGKNKGLPDDGIEEFWPGYPLLTYAEKENRTRSEYEKISAFGSRWDDVLKTLGIQPVTGTVEQRRFGKGGESADHKALKQYMRNHPEIVGATAGWECHEEYALPSLDEIDVLFKSSDECTAVEVKAAISDDYPPDYERGLYQTIKYRALLEAMALDSRYGIPSRIRVFLVLESKLPLEYKRTTEILGVEIIENVMSEG